jgi:hypothetical protein
MINANRSFGWADLAVKRFKCGHEKTPDNSYTARVTSSLLDSLIHIFSSSSGRERFILHFPRRVLEADPPKFGKFCPRV